jgi:hypothetical protein
MARYNSVNTTGSAAGGTVISTPYSGLLTTLTGSGTVTLANPVLYSGQSQSFYNSTGSAISITTPTGNFVGAGTGGGTIISLPASSVITLVSDGTNYVAQAWLGGAVTVGGTLTVNGTVSMNPSNANISIQPTGTGSVAITAASIGTMDNITIGSTTRASAKFTTLEANGVTQITANTISTAYNNGALVVTGGAGIGGSMYVAGSAMIGSTSNSNVRGILQANVVPGAPDTTGTTLAAGAFRIGTNSGNSQALDVGIYNATPYGAWLQARNSGDFTSNSPLVLNPNGGNVGIGGSSPTTALTIKKPIDSTAYGSGTRMIDFQSYYPGYDVDTIKASIYSGVSGIGTLNTQGGFLAFYTSNNGTNAERVRIEKDGGIGVNTTNTNTVTGNYMFNVALRARFNGMMLGNNDGTNASDNRILFDWSSGSAAYIYAQQNVPFYLGTNNTNQLTLQSGNVSVSGSLTINSGYNYYVNELQLTSNQNTTVSSAGPKEIFRCSSSNLVTSGIFSIAATRGNYVTAATYSWTSSYPVAGTITQLSSTNYTQHIIYLDIDSSGDCIISIDWTGYNASFPMSYQISVMKTAGSISFANAGTDWTTVSSSYTRYINYTSLANGFKANNGAFIGSLSKGSGSFKIDHPLPALTKTNYLVHSFIEGPNADLIYRGEVKLVNGQATVDIDQHSRMTDGTFEELCRKIQCFTTNETDWTPVRGKVTGNILSIEAQDLTSTATVSWMVIGERKDPHMYETDWTDINGEVIVEPLKNIVQTEFPPYPEHVNKTEEQNGTI